MKGYYNNADATRQAIDADGWLHTGDEATMDADGYLRITGRIKDIIIRGGENIAPKEIEDCLREHDAVADAYVYGLPDAFFGETVAAAVRLKPSADTDEAEMAAALVAWCASALAKFKVPRAVRFVTGFPMTASGKVQKYKLREAHQELLAKSLKSEV
jgi:fatty-acyl-CoA synthase